MGHYLELQVTRSGSPEPLRANDDSGSHCGLTFTQQPRISELMLFDASSLTVVKDYGEAYHGGPRRDLISDRASALARFRRRLPQVRAALAWNREACVTLDAFGQFFAAIDWPSVRLDTEDYRIGLYSEEDEQHFDQELDFALSALDRAAIAKPGRLLGGDGRYSADWERLLNFCYRPVCHVDDYQAAETIYRADDSAPYRPVCGTPYYWNGDNAPGCLLGAYLPRRGALTIPHIARAKALLALTPAQEAPWASLEAALRQLALVCYDRVKPAEKRLPLDPDAETRLVAQARPLLTTLSAPQQRLARRLIRAMGFSLAA